MTEVKILRMYSYPINGKRFVGNTNTREVHDLDNEKTGLAECQINEIINASHAITFNPDNLEQAHIMRYDNCAYCIGNSHR